MLATKNLTKALKIIGPIIARQKLRYDLGASFLAVINLVLIIIAASDKLAIVVDVPIRVMVAVLLPVTLAAVWLAGFVLDKLRFLDHYHEELNKRNAAISEIRENTK